MANPNRKPVAETGNLIPDVGHMAGLAVALVVLLDEAADLPEPETITIYGILGGHVHDSISIWFPDEMSSELAVASWATRFGGVIGAKTVERENGPQMWVRTEFTFMDHVKVDLHAHIPLPPPEAAKEAEQDSEPEPVTPF